MDVTDGFGFIIVLTEKFDAVFDVDDTFLFSVALVDEFFFSFFETEFFCLDADDEALDALRFF